MPERGLLERIEAYLDAAPRSGARAEPVGKFTLFLSDGPWSFYARPRLGLAEPIGVGDVDALRARQRELKAPENIEWVIETTPSLDAAARASGLSVVHYPLLVLDTLIEPPALAEGMHVRMTDADDPDFARARAVASIGFGTMGTQVGLPGATERDVQVETTPAATMEFLRQRSRDGLAISAAAFDEDGPLAVATHQPVGNVTEIVGVATLPSARRRGLGAVVTAALVADALARGVELIFLSATDDDVARVYERVGFRRIGLAGSAEAPSAPVQEGVDIDS